MHVYGTKDLVGLLGISRAKIRSLTRSGHLSPRKGERGELQFSFQDLIVLRTAKALRAASIPTRRINSSLKQLKQSLPPTVPLTGLSITSVGDRIAVREGPQRREIDSGQYVLALEVIASGGDVRIIDRGARDDDPYTIGCSLEDDNPEGAIAAYERCLASNAGHHEARLNCGRLLHLAGRLAAAERIYRDAQHHDATLLFNLGVLLEDMDREAEAMHAYRDALDLDPAFADAHFNLARLQERANNPRAALRHLLAYRRLLNQRGT